MFDHFHAKQYMSAVLRMQQAEELNETTFSDPTQPLCLVQMSKSHFKSFVANRVHLSFQAVKTT